MQLLKAPDPTAAAFKSVFLAGGITGCPDWQGEVSTALSASPLTIFNPRRDTFPSDPAAIEEQIRWEFERLRRADVISFWFPKETIHPITLFEYGAALERNTPVIVGVEPTYERRIDIEIQTKLRRPDLKIVYSLDELVGAIRELQ